MRAAPAASASSAFSRHQSKGSVEVFFTIEEPEVTPHAVEIESTLVGAEEPLDVDQVLKALRIAV